MDLHPLPARALTLVLLASCGDSAEVFEEPRTVEVAVLPAQWSPKLDLLIVVGDRPGSETLQAQLGRDLDALIAPLRAAGGARFDLHIAVTTTDLGTSTLRAPPRASRSPQNSRGSALDPHGLPIAMCQSAIFLHRPCQVRPRTRA